MKKNFSSSLITMLLVNLCVNMTYAQDEKLYDHLSLNTPPSYPGGLQKFYELLGATIKYPPMASENNIQGTTNVTFIIEKDGSLSGIKTEGRKIGYGIDEEALRVVKSGRRWNPGLLDGKPVRVKYNLPVRFALPNRPKKVSPVAPRPATTSKTSTDESPIYNHISMETPPTYPGGMASFYQFLGKSIVYPKAAIASKKQGTVKVSFTVEKDGSLTDIKTEDQSLGAGMEEEALRVMKLSRKWNPGIQDGKPVRVKYQLPIKFTMKK